MFDSQVSNNSARLTIEVLTGTSKGSVRTFSQDTISIGRSSENDLAFTDDVKMSRKHARISMTPDGFEIENMTDKNLLFVDGQPTQREKIKRVHRVMLGQTELSVSFESMSNSTATDNQEKTTLQANPNQFQNQIEKTGKSLQRVNAQTLPAQSPTLQNTPTSALQARQPGPIFIPPQNQMPNYGNPAFPLPNPAHQQKPYRSPQPAGENKSMMILLIGAIAIAGIYFSFFDKPKRKPANTEIYRSSDVIQNDRDKVKKTLEDLVKQDTKLESLQFRRAQENLDKALRDYRNGQYSLARDKFLLVLSLDPLNQTAKRYEQLSRFKLDEQIKYYSLQGRKYYERQNYRLCASSFEKVIILIQKKDDKQFQEAVEFLKLCKQSLNTRYE
ncbi:MAG: FHA domain-containing protein [Pseudobdellovibrionaceae bacterium]